MTRARVTSALALALLLGAPNARAQQENRNKSEFAMVMRSFGTASKTLPVVASFHLGERKASHPLGAKVWGSARSGPHSCRSAIIGSTRVALRAGMYVANIATAKITAGTKR